MWPEISSTEVKISEAGFFKYTVKLWISEEEKEEIRHGIVYGDSYTAACQHIDEYYGDEIVKLSVEGLEPSTVFEIESDKNDGVGDMFTISYKEKDNDF